MVTSIEPSFWRQEHMCDINIRVKATCTGILRKRPQRTKIWKRGRHCQRRARATPIVLLYLNQHKLQAQDGEQRRKTSRWRWQWPNERACRVYRQGELRSSISSCCLVGAAVLFSWYCYALKVLSLFALASHYQPSLSLYSLFTVPFALIN